MKLLKCTYECPSCKHNFVEVHARQLDAYECPDCLERDQFAAHTVEKLTTSKAKLVEKAGELIGDTDYVSVWRNAALLDVEHAKGNERDSGIYVTATVFVPFTELLSPEER